MARRRSRSSSVVRGEARQGGGLKPHVRPDHRDDDAIAFVAEPIDRPLRTSDDLAEELAEQFLLGATSGEQAAQDRFEADVPEDVGGPFVETTGPMEFGDEVDETNPEDAEREAFPTATSPPKK
ncbi:MAG: hypothetical protein HYY06_02265 [Deltaproteobacteria bacterium]|nr:hypothetical protein [Deltaproteobacteria bacterium]